MKKLLSLIFILVLSIFIVGCNSSKETTTNTSGQGSSNEQKTAGKIDTITKFSDALTTEQKKTENIINDYEGMPIMELFTPQLNLTSGVFYDVLNIDNKDGRFEGKFALSGHDGYIEKKGNISNFGYDYIVAEDNQNGKGKGDHLVESGVFDSDKQYYKSEQYTERDGKKISVSYTEFQRLADGTFLVLQSEGNAFDSRGEEVNSNKFIYLVIGEGRYDFVIAKADIGPSFVPVLLSDKGEMTKEQANELFKSSGWKIEQTGGIKDGKLVKDQ
jgi:5-hydroxyisourate hydrolase-like protein (transthyretin family)